MGRKKKAIKEELDSIRDSCDNIEAEVEDKEVETRGDPVVKIFK